MELPTDSIVGVISLKGTSNAHMAIVARAVELPAIVGIENLKLDVLDGYECILDGNTGQFFVSPSQDQLEHYEGLIEGHKELHEYLIADIFRPVQTKCGQPFELLSNVGVESDAKLALSRSAQGVGLYRTEIGFMALDRFPSESEQEALYRRYFSIFHPLPVTMRTLDIGGDKALSYFPIVEANPVLGWRGLRVTLDHPEILMIQIRAMLKASQGLNNLRILFPMVTEVRELDIAIGLVNRAFHELLDEGYAHEYPSLGAMIEVPAAISQIAVFAKRVNFISVGTNDLIQYLLAVDRNNPRVAHLFQSFHPAVLSTLEDIYLKSKAAGCELCICGEAAGDPAMTVLLMGIGFRHFSLGPNCLLKVKWTLSQMKLSQMEALWSKVSSLESVESVRETVMTQLSHYGVVSGFSSPEAQRYHQRGAVAG